MSVLDRDCHRAIISTLVCPVLQGTDYFALICHTIAQESYQVQPISRKLFEFLCVPNGNAFVDHSWKNACQIPSSGIELEIEIRDYVFIFSLLTLPIWIHHLS